MRYEALGCAMMRYVTMLYDSIRYDTNTYDTECNRIIRRSSELENATRQVDNRMYHFGYNSLSDVISQLTLLRFHFSRSSLLFER